MKRQLCKCCGKNKVAVFKTKDNSYPEFYGYCGVKCFRKHNLDEYLNSGIIKPPQFRKERQMYNKYGFIYEPTNEQEVIFLFSQIYKRLGFKNIVTLRTAYPDCIAINKRNQRIRIEFEYNSNSFNHDINGCDLIICWEDDWLECPIKVISLKEFLEYKEEDSKQVIFC